MAVPLHNAKTLKMNGNDYVVFNDVKVPFPIQYSPLQKTRIEGVGDEVDFSCTTLEYGTLISSLLTGNATYCDFAFNYRLIEVNDVEMGTYEMVPVLIQETLVGRVLIAPIIGAFVDSNIKPKTSLYVANSLAMAALHIDPIDWTTWDIVLTFRNIPSGLERAGLTKRR